MVYSVHFLEAGCSSSKALIRRDEKRHCGPGNKECRFCVPDLGTNLGLRDLCFTTELLLTFAKIAILRNFAMCVAHPTFRELAPFRKLVELHPIRTVGLQQDLSDLCFKGETANDPDHQGLSTDYQARQPPGPFPMWLLSNLSSGL